MRLSLKIAVGGCLIAKVAGNFVCPGLGKCLDLEAEVTEDGDRESVEEMTKDTKTKVQLYECHGKDNQHFEILKGQLRSFAMRDFCLTASALTDGADVHLEKCDGGSGKADMQQWEMTGDGYVKLLGSDGFGMCLDVRAEKKKDGSRETWEEIKQHQSVQIQLYTCHNPHTTERVNQLWGWMPYKHGQAVTEKTVRLWEMRGLGLFGQAPVTATGLASAAVAAAGVLAVGIAVGQRMRGAREPSLAAFALE